MFHQKSILAVCPARGGSKGLPKKNILPLGGVPLVGLVGRFIQAVLEIDRSVVSTDDDKIARIAEQHGLPASFRRPEDLSGDRIGDLDVLLHALRTVEELDQMKEPRMRFTPDVTEPGTSKFNSSRVRMLRGADSISFLSEPLLIRTCRLRLRRLRKSRVCYSWRNHSARLHWKARPNWRFFIMELKHIESLLKVPEGIEKSPLRMELGRHAAEIVGEAHCSATEKKEIMLGDG